MSPEPGSIQAILRQYCRSQLYVHPILWTQEHLRLLECQFVRIEPPTRGQGRDGDGADAPKESTEQRRLQRGRIRILERLSMSASREERNKRLMNFLESYHTHYSFQDGSRFPFLMDENTAATVDVDAVFHTGSEDSPRSPVVRLHLDTVEDLRKKRYRQWDSTTNEPLADHCRRKLRLLTPADTAEDPYLAAVLIAMAQMQRMTQTQQATTSWTPPGSDEAPMPVDTTPTAFKVHLIVLSSQQPAELYLYQASIPSAFLDKFERTSCASPCGPVRILYDKFSLQHPQRLVEQFPRVLGWGPKQGQVRKAGGSSSTVEGDGGTEDEWSTEDDEGGEEWGWEE
ncbi:uncharacterized protein B0H64DRAFT_373099 [Chaetomium fimeti]|uniref:Uncharacterized protein n=1 Tax=Chaetomium fimeti TaxID=1854472 RepID=A0AAE0HK99_9PEZI|nr:hypothetical protein B0H64DRAFT_373099 [Chaetomium fimeti]